MDTYFSGGGDAALTSPRPGRPLTDLAIPRHDAGPQLLGQTSAAFLRQAQAADEDEDTSVTWQGNARCCRGTGTHLWSTGRPRASRHVSSRVCDPTSGRDTNWPSCASDDDPPAMPPPAWAWKKSRSRPQKQNKHGIIFQFCKLQLILHKLKFTASECNSEHCPSTLYTAFFLHVHRQPLSS